MARLFEHFSGVFSSGLDFQASATGTESLRTSAAEAKAELISRIGAAETAARQDGKCDPDIAEAKRALVAWIDELMANQCYRGSWRQIQEEMFQTSNLGRQFFTQLEALSPRQEEVREVYYTALLLGFKGRHDREPEKLPAVMAAHADRLPVKPEDLDHLASQHITAQPYKTPDPDPRVVLPSQWGEYLLAGCVAALIFVPAGFWVYKNSDKLRPPPNIGPAIEQTMKTHICAGADHTIVDNNVTVRGFLANPQEGVRLIEALEAIEGIGNIYSELHALENPDYCRVLRLVLPFAPGRGSDVRKTTISYAIEERKLRNASQQFLLVDVSSPETEVFVYIDYFTLDSQVWHMLPNAFISDNRVVPGGTIRIGEPGVERRFYTVKEPYVEELIVGLTSPERLFPDLRQESEALDEYLLALRARLDKFKREGREDEIGVRYFLVRPKPAP